MSRSLRIALTWLLLLALPLQAFAAATMLNCGPKHHQRDAEHQHERQHHAMGAEAQTHTQPHTHTHTQTHTPMQAAAGGEPHDAATGDDLAKSKCSACAVCCLSAALPARAIVIPALAPPAVVAWQAEAPPIGFFTDGPDRPPRSLHA